MVVRILLAMLLIGLGVHHVAPLMPAADGMAHTAHASHQQPCTGDCPSGHHDGMGMALVCIGMLAIAASLPRVRRRLAALLGRLASVPRPRMLTLGALVSRGPPAPVPQCSGVAVLRC